MADHRGSRGQAMVEFALLVPLFALFLVIAVDFGRVFFSYVQITNAAREAANLAATQQEALIDDAAILAKAESETNVQEQGGEGAISVETVCRNPAGTVIACSAAAGGSGAGNTVTVAVEEPFTFITPLVGSIVGDFTMRTSATSTVLGFAAGGPGGGGPPSGTCSLPVPSFTVIVTSGLSIEVDPAASSPQTAGDPCNISGYFWYWGNGEDQPGHATATTYTYPAAGTYTIRLEVTNQAGLQSTTRTVTVPETAPPTCDAPNAAFTVSEAGKVHTYSDTSTVADETACPITQWLWTFGNGTQSNAPFPTAVTYGNNASHTTTLTVTNSGGSDTFSWNH